METQGEATAWGGAKHRPGVWRLADALHPPTGVATGNQHVADFLRDSTLRWQGQRLRLGYDILVSRP